MVYHGNDQSFVLIKVLQPAYFAREDMKTPMWFSLVSLVVNAGGSLAMFPVLGHVGIAAATSFAGWANAMLLGWTLWRRNQFRPSPETLRRVLLIIVSAAAMGVVLFGAWHYLRDSFLTSNILIRAGIAALLIGVSMIVYFGLALATGGIDRSMLMRTVKRRRSSGAEQ